MKRSEFEQKLAMHADGELDAPDAVAIEKHLAFHPEDKAIVARWEQLRASAKRAVDSEPIPAGLAERIRAALPQGDDSAASEPPFRKAPRVYRLGVSGLAAAAVIVLAIIFLPGATRVDVAGFSGIYHKCAVSLHHDSLSIRGGTAWKDFVNQPNRLPVCTVEGKAPFACRVPNLPSRGFMLEGACTCSPCDGIRVVHVYFREVDNPDNVVSVFVMEEPIELCANGEPCGKCQMGGGRYRSADHSGLSLAAWDADGHSYVVVCSEANRDHVMEVVGLVGAVPIESVISPLPVCTIMPAGR